ncbi:MAG: class I SAM-dependent methyltransferase [Magnetospirillum sp. WYHS-4]
MWTDAVDLRDFYATSLGRVAGRVIANQVRQIWPDVKGMNVLGLGFATPFLNPFRNEAARLLAAMPAQQGVLPWPTEGRNLTTLVDEADLPFPDLSMDRVLLVHGLECAEPLRPMMREIWRVLAGGGRLLVVVPNRRGLWARFERSPFGHGRPYSSGQLSRALRDCLFTPAQSYPALFVPPLRSRTVLSTARAWETLGQRWFPAFGGVVMIEATKQIYAGHLATPLPKRAKGYLPLAQRRTTPQARG